MVMVKVGARRWIARIMVTWGIISMAMAFVGGEKSLYTVRFLLGVAEAGFFPAVIFYLSHWFPKSYRGRVIGLFMVASPASSLIGAPISTALLEYSHGLGGFSGWQWLFLLEGLPAFVVGFVCLFYLTERPRDAKWLAPDEASWLQEHLDRERSEMEVVRKYHFREVFVDFRVGLLAIVLLCLVSGSYGAGFWMPQIIKTFTTSNMVVGWTTAGIYLITVISMILWTRFSDALGRRVGPVAIGAAFAAIGYFICAATMDKPYLAIFGLIIANVGINSSIPVFWTIPTYFLTGTAAAVAIALINSVAQLAGILGPWLIGVSKDATGGFVLALGVLGAGLLVGAAVILLFGYVSRTSATAGRNKIEW
jgi:ACS family tartrate transporter-like MFS transporter